jgi:hypothetical protein
MARIAKVLASNAPLRDAGLRSLMKARNSRCSEPPLFSDREAVEARDHHLGNGAQEPDVPVPAAVGRFGIRR